MRDDPTRLSPAQLDGSPRRHFSVGRDLARMRTIGDLRARAQRRVLRFVLEYLEGGAEDEATLARERGAFGDWRFVPRTLVDVANRSLERDQFGTRTPMPLTIAPTGLNGVFQRGADVAWLGSAQSRRAVKKDVRYFTRMEAGDGFTFWALELRDSQRACNDGESSIMFRGSKTSHWLSNRFDKADISRWCKDLPASSIRRHRPSGTLDRQWMNLEVARAIRCSRAD